MLFDLILKTRSYRRFYQSEPIAMEDLHHLIEYARFAGSARNVQPLKYMLINNPEMNAAIFPQLGWAGYLPEWRGPVEGERPAAYIICLLDRRICEEADCDLGIATQNILLGATELGLGGCRIASISPKLHALLNLPDWARILLVIALGKPKEKVVVDTMFEGDSCRYWRDAEQVHHVPKRGLLDIILTYNPL